MSRESRGRYEPAADAGREQAERAGESSVEDPSPTTAQREVTVGVIDSGWDREFVDPRVLPGVGLVDPLNELALGWSVDDGDRNGHGTSATSLLLQVAPEATVVPIRVFGRRLETSPEVLVAAIDWAVARGIPVLNVSLGTLRDDALVRLYGACERARRAGTVIVAAAANRLDGWSFPAVFEPVIGVGPATVQGPFDIVYRPDAALECGARAVGVRARSLGGKPVVLNGTSFAAPIVAGHVARLLSRSEELLDVNEVRCLLRRMYTPPPRSSTPSPFGRSSGH